MPSSHADRILQNPKIEAAQAVDAAVAVVAAAQKNHRPAKAVETLKEVAREKILTETTRNLFNNRLKEMVPVHVLAVRTARMVTALALTQRPRGAMDVMDAIEVLDEATKGMRTMLTRQGDTHLPSGTIRRSMRAAQRWIIA